MIANVFIATMFGILIAAIGMRLWSMPAEIAFRLAGYFFLGIAASWLFYGAFLKRFR